MHKASLLPIIRVYKFRKSCRTHPLSLRIFVYCSEYATICSIQLIRCAVAGPLIELDCLTLVPSAVCKKIWLLNSVFSYSNLTQEIAVK